ncbi:NADH-quinone oxidoreductase subunit NuoF [candidate division WOR-3 bacterium]|nr:NADH-quinone oxidoreductase subunit NuoF [candidate division WOR-3 bacterium]
MERTEILNKYPKCREQLLNILHDIQNSSGNNVLTEHDLAAVAEYIGMSKVEVMGVATFYSMYSLSKRGKNVIRLCVSPACHLMRSGTILDYLKKKLNVDLAEITEDGLFTIEEAACFGICGVAPAMMINDKVYGNLNEGKIDTIIDSYKSGSIADKLLYKSIADKVDGETRKVIKGLGEIDPVCIDDYKKINGFKGLEKALKTEPKEIIEIVKASGLRGRGGAGFPAGLKWSFTAPIEGKKFIICNADEGEPGTFKDRFIMEGLPMRLIEGMIIAGYAIGSHKGFIYIRGEYTLSIDNLTKAIDKCREQGILGDNILNSGFAFDIAIRKGAGAYVCGEETSLIESMEGKRGNPRNKPPFPGVEGFRALPSVVNNVETLANVPIIIAEGAEEFKKLGTEKSAGTKLFTVMGDVNKPGLVELPMGITLKELIFKYAGGIKDGKEFKAALIGGAAGCIVGDKALEMKLDYDSPIEFEGVLGSGAVLIMNKERDMKDILKSIMYFFKHESCGKCSPCRIGTKILFDISEKIASGNGEEKDLEKMKDLANNMQLTSFCPLGQSPIVPIRTVAKYFANEIINK